MVCGRFCIFFVVGFLLYDADASVVGPVLPPRPVSFGLCVGVGCVVGIVAV